MTPNKARHLTERERQFKPLDQLSAISDQLRADSLLDLPPAGRDWSEGVARDARRKPGALAPSVVIPY